MESLHFEGKTTGARRRRGFGRQENSVSSWWNLSTNHFRNPRYTHLDGGGGYAIQAAPRSSSRVSLNKLGDLTRSSTLRRSNAILGLGLLGRVD